MAESRALQAHINPHFLFNILNQMVGITVRAGNTQLAQMLTSLANIFRYAIRKPGALVTLQEELNYLEEYIALQRLRYEERFTFEAAVPSELLTIPVLKFCLQPVVKNCFIHGLEKSFDPIHILLEIKADDDRLIIKVSDDGLGITEEHLKEINRSLEMDSDTFAKRGNSIGLANLHHRIRYSYGLKYRITLTPLSPGLAVSICLPIIIFPAG
jgi:sensor histidine kinase YesM